MPLDAQPQQMFLTVTQVARRYGVSADTIWRWRRNDSFPAPVKLGPNCTRWRQVDLDSHESTLQAGLVIDADCWMAA